MAATANAACTTDATKTMTDCAAKLHCPLMATRLRCANHKGAMACYPKCYCDDSSQAAKDAIAASEKGYKDAGCDGEAKCGAGSMLAPGLAMAAVAVVVAKLA